jgi:superfamily II DNA or RNA helicase
MKTLRLDQSTALTGLREALRETRRVVLQFPTGAGKTVIAAEIIRMARDKDKRALITVPALELVDQTVEALWEQDVTEVGVIQADNPMTDWSKPVQVASVQTLIRRGLPDADIALIDECHRWHHFFENWFGGKEIFAKWRKIPIIGLSATPWSKALGGYFDKLIIGNTIGKMIIEKSLVPFKVFAASHPDLDGVRSRIDKETGETDYVQDDLHGAMIRPKLVADAVESWKALAEGRPTICFAVSRDHAACLAKKFQDEGVPSGYMDCDTPSPQRKELRQRFLVGEIKVVCNVDVIGLGVDWPEVSCISYCRPTRSEMRFVQNIGRGLRICAGKEDLLVLDHSDTTMRLGFVSDIIHEELIDGRPDINGAKLVELPKECPACHYLKPPRTAVCPACGHKTEHHAKPILHDKGSLKELSAEDIAGREMPVAKKLGKTLEDKAKVYGQLLWYARAHKYRDGWAIVKYKEIYGVLPWPVINAKTWVEDFHAPDMVLASWIKSQFIKYAKRKNRWGENGHANGNGHADDDGALSERGQAIIDRAQEYVDGTLMTEADFEEFR